MNQKIKEIGSAESWNGKHGEMFEIEITLEDGRVGRVNAKTPDRWKAGDEIIITEERVTNYGTKWKFDKPQYQGGGGGNSSSGNSGKGSVDEISASWAIGIAVSAGFRDQDSIIAGAKQALHMHDIVVGYIKDQRNGDQSKEGAQIPSNENQTASPEIPGEEKGDLPF